ncbi:zona pellucida sperm-binding protein 4-like [Heterodontus francisci]|uniref:zona pellucida sperm-binding protein 4-like n=1 Tax=Heterodontus francisci TaxID=7792 RepID=UPI00355C7CDD
MDIRREPIHRNGDREVKEGKGSVGDGPCKVCTKDGRVLIAISKDLTLPPVNLTTVHLKDGHGAECSPTVASVDTVLFEFALTECGTSQRLDGVDVVYETDVLAQFEILDGALGSVSRDSPFRLHVQCSYKGSQESELQLKPRVYTLSPPLPATETGILLLELRIARDAAYRSWYVASDYPILSVLREPVFVEVRVLNRNDPSLVLVLNECWASPTAEPYSQLQWKLLVNRCPFTGDNYKSRLLPLDAASHLRFPTHHKRFVVSTFTFWERVSGRPLSGEVYFHCSAEVCSPSSRENCTASCSPKRRRSTNDQSGTLVTTGPIIFLEDGESLSAGIQQEEKVWAVAEQQWKLNTESEQLLGIVKYRLITDPLQSMKEVKGAKRMSGADSGLKVGSMEAESIAEALNYYLALVLTKEDAAQVSDRRFVSKVDTNGIKGIDKDLDIMHGKINICQ